MTKPITKPLSVFQRPWHEGPEPEPRKKYSGAVEKRPKIRVLVLALALACAAFGQTKTLTNESTFQWKAASTAPTYTLKAQTAPQRIEFYSRTGQPLMKFDAGQVIKNMTTGACVYSAKQGDEYRFDFRRVPCPDSPLMVELRRILFDDEQIVACGVAPARKWGAVGDSGMIAQQDLQAEIKEKR